MVEQKRKKVTIKQILAKKKRNELILAMGVFDSPMARIADEVGFDLLINGNAGPMTVLGHRTPLDVRFEEQLILTQAVSRVAKYGMIVSHMPYMTYHASKEDAIRNAARLVSEGGADVVKCEGNKYTAQYVAEIVRAGIPVIGHMGMQLSRFAEQSGFGLKGRTAEEGARIVEDARAFVDAGAFCLIMEWTPVEISTYLASTLPVPVIGTSGTPTRDGYYVAFSDLTGYGLFRPSKDIDSILNVTPMMEKALRTYKEQILGGALSGPEIKNMLPEEHDKFLRLVA